MASAFGDHAPEEIGDAFTNPVLGTSFHRTVSYNRGKKKHGEQNMLKHSNDSQTSEEFDMN